MGVCSIGDAVAGIISGRGQTRCAPVRSGSYHVGSFENGFWRQPDHGDFALAMAGARALERETRRDGRPQGAVGPVALELLALLYRLGRRFKGHIEPSLDFMMRGIKRSRTAVVRALKQLREAGFLEWRRRFVTVERCGPGPRRRQTSNTYRLQLPKAIERLLGKRAKSAPIPDDAAQQIAQAKDDHHRMLEGLSPREFAYAVADGALAESLASLGEAIASNAQCELSGRPEPRHKLIHTPSAATSPARFWDSGHMK